MGEKRMLTLRSLAGLDSPFEKTELKAIVEQRLKEQNSEGRYWEWKLHGPFATGVNKGTKYRIVKSIVSFANTYGGFIIFGVDSSGKWVGLSKEELGEFDPSKITELVNGCITPDITEFNIYFSRVRRKEFVILHVPPSKIMPHVTTKEVFEQTEDNKRRVILRKHIMYCRFSGKSDVARYADYQRIIKKRMDVLREALLRRFNEVTVTKPNQLGVGPQGSSHVVRVVESTKDSSVPLLKVTRKIDGTHGTLLHEALSEGLFNEINNVLDANKLLAKGNKKFVLGLEVYYRIYAEREHVEPTNEHILLLAQTGFRFYAPILYWFLQLPSSQSAKMIRDACSDPKANTIYNVLRLAILLGSEVSMWVEDRLDEKWAEQMQPPPYYEAFKKMMSSKRKDRTLVALRAIGDRYIELPEEGGRLLFSDLLEHPEKALSMLCKYCLRVFEGRKDEKSICRYLDVLGYGKEFEAQGQKIASALIENN